MSTSDQQGNSNVPLTRKQLREIRLTGATPVITPEAGATPAPQLPRAAEPIEVPPPPAPPVPEDGETPRPLTRRQLREMQRLQGGATAPAAEPPAAPAAEPAPVEAPVAAPAPEPAPEATRIDEAETQVEEPVQPAEERPVVDPSFGEGVTGASDVPTFTPSFDELISSDTTGSHHVAPSTIIFTPPPGQGSIAGPVAATGEILVTGSYELPEGIGSQGHAHGTADGKDVDSVLIDGELPPASSPTPIAASSAVSTIKPAGEVIRPPAPEKGSKLMLTLAITAGGLALAVAAVLIVAFTMNIF